MALKVSKGRDAQKKLRRSCNFSLRQSKPTKGAMNQVKYIALENTNKQKGKFKVNNWSANNKALTNRRRITLWLSDDVIDLLCRKEERQPRGKMKYSEACMAFLLSLMSLSRLGFRQTEDLCAGKAPAEQVESND
jgi:hypothetical protein